MKYEGKLSPFNSAFTCSTKCCTSQSYANPLILAVGTLEKQRIHMLNISQSNANLLILAPVH